MNNPLAYSNFRVRRDAPSAKSRTLAQWRGWDSTGDEKARRISSRKAGDVMSSVLSGLRIDQRQSETEILKVWNHIMDPNVTAHAQPTGIRKGTLFVTVDHSAWLDEIVRYRRKEILDRLQSSFGKDLITRISFRVG